MSWFLSILLGLLVALLGGVAGAVIGSLNVRWYRISGFEGGAGYYLVLITLLGILVGLVVGIATARVVAGWSEPGFGRALGIATLALSGIAALVTLACRLGADLAPTLDGNPLELAVEVRAPRGFTMPVDLDQYGAHAYVSVIGGRSQPRADLRLDQAQLVDGRWIVPVDVPLCTRASRKLLRVYFNESYDALFNLPLRARPKVADLVEWSPWIEAGYPVGEARPAPDDAFFMRYRVKVIEPPPKVAPEDHAAARDAEQEAALQALDPDAPLRDWLPFASYRTPEQRRTRAIAKIAMRPALVEEIGALLESADDEQAEDVLRLIGRLTPPPAALAAPVARFGQELARRIRAGNAVSPEIDPACEWAASISIRFVAWMEAVRALRTNADADLVPELREILELARERPDSRSMRMDVVRVASYYLHQWAGVEPLSTDPPPR